MSFVQPQLSPTFTALQRLEREEAALAEKLAALEGRLAQLEAGLTKELSAQQQPSLPTMGEPERARSSYSYLRLTGPEDLSSLVGGDEDLKQAMTQVSRLDRRSVALSDSPLEASAPGSDAVHSLLAEIEPLEKEIRTLRSRRDDVESRIAIFQAWAFEEVPTPLPPGIAPLLARVLAPASAESESFRLLRTKIQSLDEEAPFRRIGFVSAAPSEGKTSVALAIALYMAQEPGSRILLVEADLRRPRISSYLGLPRRVGLGEWLQGAPGPLRLQVIEPHGLYLLPAGAPVAHAAELLASGRMAQLLDVARQSFDFVLLDCPPPVPLADSVILQDLLDGFLMVVRARHTPRENLAAAISHLRADAIRAVIFNDHREILPRFYTRSFGSYNTRG